MNPDTGKWYTDDKLGRELAVRDGALPAVDAPVPADWPRMGMGERVTITTADGRTLNAWVKSIKGRDVVLKTLPIVR